MALASRCPFCLSTAVAENLPVKEMCKGTREVFEYALCANCGSAYISEFPENIADYYEGYFSLQDNVPTIDKSRLKLALASVYSWLFLRRGMGFLLRPFFRCPFPWQMKLLVPNLQAFLFIGARSSARILDVGSGSGQFVKLIMRFGYRDVTGVDPFVDETSKCDQVIRGDIFSLTGKYDVILFNHSLEHMTGPEAALKKAADLLAPGGVIVVHIPNLDSRDFPIYKQHWCWMHAPYHYAIPSRKGVEELAARCSIKVADVICTSRADHYLYSDEYRRDIADKDSRSVRRQVEDGSLDKQKLRALAKLAYASNRTLTGDWIAYYLVAASASGRWPKARV